MTRTVCDECGEVVDLVAVHLIVPGAEVRDPDGGVHHYDFCDIRCLQRWVDDGGEVLDYDDR